MDKSVRHTAFKDITSWIKETYKPHEIITKKGLPTGESDVWVACPVHIETKETIRLNRLLNIHKINKQKRK